MKQSNLSIKHDQEHQLFLIKLQNSPAYLSYTKPRKEIMDLKETYVPVESRKKGVGSALVHHVLEFAAEARFKIIPTCPFVQEYIQDHADYKKLVLEDAVDSEIR